MLYEIIVLTLLLPACVSAAAVFAELLSSGSRPTDERADRSAWVAGGVAAAGSFLLSYWLYSWTEIDPSDHWHWLPQAILAVTLTSLLAAMSGSALARVTVLLAVFVFAWLLTPSWDEIARNRPWIAIGLAMGILIYLGFAWPLTDQRRANQRWLIGLVLTLHLAAATVVILCSGWAKLAQLSALPMMVFGVLTVVSWLYPHRQFLYGAVPTFAVAFAAMLLLAWYSTYSPISWWAFAMLALGPVALLVVLMTLPHKFRRAELAAVLSVLIFPLTGVIVAIATTH